MLENLEQNLEGRRSGSHSSSSSDRLSPVWVFAVASFFIHMSGGCGMATFTWQQQFCDHWIPAVVGSPWSLVVMCPWSLAAAFKLLLFQPSDDSINTQCYVLNLFMMKISGVLYVFYTETWLLQFSNSYLWHQLTLEIKTAYPTALSAPHLHNTLSQT